MNKSHVDPQSWTRSKLAKHLRTAHRMPQQDLDANYDWAELHQGVHEAAPVDAAEARVCEALHREGAGCDMEFAFDGCRPEQHLQAARAAIAAYLADGKARR